MPRHRLCKVVVQAHVLIEDEDGNVIREYMGQPVPLYTQEQMAEFLDAARAECEQASEEDD